MSPLKLTYSGQQAGSKLTAYIAQAFLKTAWLDLQGLDRSKPSLSFVYFLFRPGLHSVPPSEKS